MSKSNAFETAFLNHLFKNLAIANIGDATGLPAAATAGSLYIGLHTASPGEAGNQTTNEATYTDYARVAIARSGAGWVVSGNQASNAALITFPTSAGTDNTITHFSIGTDSTGTGNLLIWGTLGDSVFVGTGVTPTFAIGALVVTED